MESAKLILEVVAGVIPRQPIPEYTRRYAITSAEWAEAGDKQMELLAEVNGKAQGYAGLLMLQPNALNWVETTWLWV